MRHRIFTLHDLAVALTALETNHPKPFAAWQLCEMQKLTHDQAAAQLGVTRPAITQRLTTARAYLRDILCIDQESLQAVI